MTAKVAKPRRSAKFGRFPRGNQNFPQGNQISPVMQKVRISLKDDKAAQELNFLTAQPISICQKTLSGHRVENRDMLVALFRTRLIAAAVVGLTEGVDDPDARALRKLAKRLMLEQRHRRDREQLDLEGDA